MSEMNTSALDHYNERLDLQLQLYFPQLQQNQGDSEPGKLSKETTPDDSSDNDENSSDQDETAIETVFSPINKARARSRLFYTPPHEEFFSFETHKSKTDPLVDIGNEVKNSTAQEAAKPPVNRKKKQSYRTKKFKKALKRKEKSDCATCSSHGTDNESEKSGHAKPRFSLQKCGDKTKLMDSEGNVVIHNVSQVNMKSWTQNHQELSIEDEEKISKIVTTFKKRKGLSQTKKESIMGPVSICCKGNRRFPLDEITKPMHHLPQDNLIQALYKKYMDNHVQCASLANWEEERRIQEELEEQNNERWKKEFAKRRQKFHQKQSAGVKPSTASPRSRKLHKKRELSTFKGFPAPPSALNHVKPIDMLSASIEKMQKEDEERRRLHLDTNSSPRPATSPPQLLTPENRSPRKRRKTLKPKRMPQLSKDDKEILKHIPNREQLHIRRQKIKSSPARMSKLEKMPSLPNLYRKPVEVPSVTPRGDHRRFSVLSPLAACDTELLQGSKFGSKIQSSQIQEKSEVKKKRSRSKRKKSKSSKKKKHKRKRKKKSSIIQEPSLPHGSSPWFNKLMKRHRWLFTEEQNEN